MPKRNQNLHVGYSNCRRHSNFIAVLLMTVMNNSDSFTKHCQHSKTGICYNIIFNQLNLFTLTYQDTVSEIAHAKGREH